MNSYNYNLLAIIRVKFLVKVLNYSTVHKSLTCCIMMSPIIAWLPNLLDRCSGHSHRPTQEVYQYLSLVYLMLKYAPQMSAVLELQRTVIRKYREAKYNIFLDLCSSKYCYKKFDKGGLLEGF